MCYCRRTCIARTPCRKFHVFHLKDIRDLKNTGFDCGFTFLNLRLPSDECGASCELILWGWRTSRGQNKPHPCSHNNPQQVDHLVWKQNTFPGFSFCVISSAHIPYIAFLVHMLPLISSNSSLDFSLCLFSPLPFFPSPCCSMSLRLSEGHQETLKYPDAFH